MQQYMSIPGTAGAQDAERRSLAEFPQWCRHCPCGSLRDGDAHDAWLVSLHGLYRDLAATELDAQRTQ